MIKFIYEDDATEPEYPCERLEMMLKESSFDGVAAEFVHFALACGYSAETIRECLAEKAEEMGE